jgi:hypothetical protein
MALDRHGIKHGSQASIGYELGLTLPPNKRLKCLFPKAKFTRTPPSAGYGTRVGIKRYSINSYFKRHGIRLTETYYPTGDASNILKLASKGTKKGDDVLVCFNHKALYGGRADWGHVCIINSISGDKANLIDPDDPHRISVDFKKLVKAMRYHGRKNRGGLWIISKTE